MRMASLHRRQLSRNTWQFRPRENVKSVAARITIIFRWLLPLASRWIISGRYSSASGRDKSWKITPFKAGRWMWICLYRWVWQCWTYSKVYSSYQWEAVCFGTSIYDNDRQTKVSNEWTWDKSWWFVCKESSGAAGAIFSGILRALQNNMRS